MAAYVRRTTHSIPRFAYFLGCGISNPILHPLSRQRQPGQASTESAACCYLDQDSGDVSRVGLPLREAHEDSADVFVEEVFGPNLCRHIAGQLKLA
jgi:hypothetical protein